MREQFLLDPGLVFLNHGSFGACPKVVLEDQWHWQLELERNPVEFLGRRSAELLWQARAELGAAIGARADELVFVPNATTGVNVVAASLKLQPGDEVVATDLEYGACDAAWQQACARQRASYRRVEIPLPYDRSGVLDRLMAATGPRTRLIYLSHLTSTTALILPVAEVCAEARRRGVLTLVDGAHAPGQLALDLAAIGADFYVGNCHKWLCAPKGSGFLQARAEHHAMLDASVISWGYAQGTGGHAGFDAYLGRTEFERRLARQLDVILGFGRPLLPAVDGSTRRASATPGAQPDDRRDDHRRAEHLHRRDALTEDRPGEHHRRDRLGVQRG